MHCLPSRPRPAPIRLFRRYSTPPFRLPPFSLVSRRSGTSARAHRAPDMAVIKPAGSWTYEDLFTLPDDGRRYEIIGGELFEKPPPSLVHATVIANLIALLIPLINELGGRWYTAPVGVFVAGANPVEPDIVVILPGGAARRERRGIEGPPDLVIEVLSPSNQNHDV